MEPSDNEMMLDEFVDVNKFISLLELREEPEMRTDFYFYDN